MTVVSTVLLASLPLWFCADFDQPSELGGFLFEQNMNAGRAVEGRFGKGYAFESAKPRAEHEFWRISDRERLADFPWKEGSFACWFKGGDPGKVLNPFFSYGGFWSFDWALSGAGFNASAVRGAGASFKPVLRGTNVWRHIVATWGEEQLAVYLDGRLLAERANPPRTDMRNVKRAVLRFGTGGEGRPASGLVLDDIAVFSRSLTAEEAKTLAASDVPLRAPGTANPPLRDEFADAAEPPPEGTFILHSWGGGVGESTVFRKTMGLNCINVRAEDVSAARACAREGFLVNLRIENSGDWRTLSAAGIRSRLSTLLRPYRTLKNWRTALVNSEVYGASRIRTAVSNENWMAFATRKLGFAPELGFGFAPPALDYGKLGATPFSGVLPTDCRSLNTLQWFLKEGDPVYSVNRVSGGVIRELRPDVTVWSEPSPSAIGLDMLADWIYDYGTDFCLYNFRRMDAHARAQGVRFMPTLSGSYHHSWEPRGRHPQAKDKKGAPLAVRFAQSCDETVIKTWMALGAAKADALSYFNAGFWEQGAENARAFAADPSTPVSCLAETDFAERYGRFIREEFQPVAAKLRNAPNARAKLAFAPLPESMQAGTARWAPYHYHRMIGTCLARGPVAFDVLDAGEIRPEVLAQYRYVLVPMIGGVITKAHYEAFCAVAGKTKVVVDAYCNVDIPNAEKLSALKHGGWTGDKAPTPVDVAAQRELGAWLASHADELRREAFAWSDRDGLDAFTFVKDLPDGGKAVLVVNDKREDRSLWPQFCADPRYRPVAAPNRITVHFALRGALRKLECDFKPAEAKLFLVSRGMESVEEAGAR